MNNNNEVLLRIENIWKTYKSSDKGAEVEALSGINLEIKKNEFKLIIGSSGCGKSTLLHILGLLDRPTKGKIFLERNDVSSLNDKKMTYIRLTKLGFVFQTYNLLPTLDVFNNIAVVLRLTKFSKKEINNKVISLLKDMDLEKRIHHSINKLSGGEHQRVAIARALANDPDIIFADEPTGNLDSKNGDKIFNLFLELNKKGKTIVMVTHNLEYTKKISNILEMRDGKII